MRVEHIDFRVTQQKTYREFILQAFPNLTNVGTEMLNKHRIEARLEAVQEQWFTFSTQNDAILLAISKIEAKEQRRIKQRSYFREGHYASTYEAYLETIEKMKELLEKYTKAASDPPSTTNSQTAPSATYYHPTRLPRIDLPTFNGALVDWLSFKGLFMSLVLDNPSISSVEKLQYLKTSLTGSAAHLLKNTALTEDNFPTAWNAVISFYENPRLLVNSALQSLYAVKKINRESAGDLEQLYTSFMQAYRSLETLRRPVQQCDDFLVFMAVQRLDPESAKAWEGHLGSSKIPPTWEQFRDFLMTRMLSLQAFEHSQGTKPTSIGGFSGKGQQQAQVRSHFTGASNSSEARPVSSNSCIVCSDAHYIARCPQYQQMSATQRQEMTTSRGLCYNCLGPHKVANCRSTKRCLICGRRHHTTLHHSNGKSSDGPPSELASNAADSLKHPKQVNHSHRATENRVTILLATARIRAVNQFGAIAQARAILDQGSEISLVTEDLVQRLHLPRHPSKVTILGVGDKQTIKTRGIVSFVIKPHYESSISIPITAYILSKLTSDIPAIPPLQNNWPHLDKLTLADPSFNSQGRVDLLIGANLYGHLLEGPVIHGPSVNSPVAQHTKLGWIVSGPCDISPLNRSAQSFHVTIDHDYQELQTLLERFWTLEEIPETNNSCLSPNDQNCENHFLQTHSRDPDGHYVVKLPFKEHREKLGDSKPAALRMLQNIQHKFKTDPNYYSAYSAFLQEYQNLDHMAIVADKDKMASQIFYLPHHGVIRESSTTTKLRVVFNGSCRTVGGQPLNELLHTGAKLQVNLFDVLIWFRHHKYIFSSDMEKMYRQIKIHPDDWDFQRILWQDPQRGIIEYQLKTVTYGLACAPFLALRAVQQLIIDDGPQFPLAVEPLTKGRYVDDIFGGSHSLELAQQQATQISKLCMAGGFPLRKWISNHPSVLQLIPRDYHLSTPSIEIQDTIVHALGLSWKSTSDTLQFKLALSNSHAQTKRAVLSLIAQLFDPLGFLSPALIRCKIFMQQMWTLQLNWDDKLPPDTQATWNKLLEELQGLELIAVPRWIGLAPNVKAEIHGFCDASQKAMAAVVYMRTTAQDGQISVSLVCSKTKVTPLKRMTIPRLELTAGVMLSKLVSHCNTNFSSNHPLPCYLWTDSTIVYTWLNNHPSQWKEFVHNRVCYIHEILPHARWNHVAGNINPADCATRGLSAIELRDHVIWWSGPEWLSQPSCQWTQHSISSETTSSRGKQELSSINLERRPAETVSLHLSMHQEEWNLLSKYSNLQRLLRITTLILRAGQLFRKLSDRPLRAPITPEDILTSTKFWVKRIQDQHFKNEIDCLLQHKEISKSSRLLRLTPFLDKNKLLRVGGRLHNSSLPYASKHPWILPSESRFSTMIIEQAHLLTLHGATQVTLSYVRNDYWILGGRTSVRSIILKCVVCTRHRRANAQQIMGQLPPSRVTPSRPFLHSGVDYAGPFTVKTWRGRGAPRTYKCWVSLFVCYATSAIHLELVTDYSTAAFLAAYKRFSSRRGICATLTSDCGTNFKGADSELRDLFFHSSEELQQVASLIANDGTTWKFNPPGAPHFGGKFEAGVKSMKHHLRRVVGESVLTYEEMSTVLNQIEAILNSRPLCPLTEDPDDLDVLTPGHFLIGHALTLVPEPNLETLPMHRLSQWQRLTQMIQSFWTKWSKEYLQRLQAIYKWNRQSPPIKEGTLVLIVDERYPPSKWPLGRIIKAKPGPDNAVRVVTIKTASGILTRPVVKICPLPVSAADNDSSSPESTKAGGNDEREHPKLQK